MNRQRVMLAGIIVVVVIGLWYEVLWSPQTKSLAKARTRRDSAVEQTQQLQTQLQRLRASQQNEAAKLAQLEKLTSAIPDQADLAQFILDTNTAANQAGVAFLSITPTPPAAVAASPGAGAAGGGAAGGSAAAGGGAAGGATPAGSAGGAAPSGSAAGAAVSRPADIRLGINLTGGYFQVLDFMNRLDQLPRLVVIDQLSVTPQAAANGTVQLTVSLTGRMFVNPSAVGSGASGAATTTTTPAGRSTTTTAAGGPSTTSTTR